MGMSPQNATSALPSVSVQKTMAGGKLTQVKLSYDNHTGHGWNSGPVLGNVHITFGNSEDVENYVLQLESVLNELRRAQEAFEEQE